MDGVVSCDLLDGCAVTDHLDGELSLETQFVDTALCHWRKSTAVAVSRIWDPRSDLSRIICPPQWAERSSQ